MNVLSVVLYMNSQTKKPIRNVLNAVLGCYVSSLWVVLVSKVKGGPRVDINNEEELKEFIIKLLENNPDTENTIDDSVAV